MVGSSKTTVITDETSGRASEARQTSVEIPTRVRGEVVRAVGAAFLRIRPMVVLPVAVANALLLARADVSLAQRQALGGAIGTALALFTIEAWVFRAKPVGERWLVTSLALTLFGLSFGCALSGGTSSPLLPLALAPVVVSFAAFGQNRKAFAMLAAALGSSLVLALLPEGTPFPPIPSATARWMTFATFTAATALAYAGVSGLVEAHARAAETLDRMRLVTLEEAASRMRATEQVGAKVAHELKNPLAAIRALVQLLSQGETDPRTNKRLEVALTEIDRMDAIVRDYLAYARPLADLRTGAVDALTVARDVCDVLEARAEAAGVTVEARGESAEIMADARRLREALLNLADNALSATPRGGSVTVTVAKHEGGARILVEDDGSGLPAGLREGVTTKPGGSGLGLVLARAAIAQHGGTVALASREPRGTIVTIVLPREPPHEEETT